MLDNKRDTTQAEAVKAWGEEGRGTIILPTGYGKTRCGVMARESLGRPKTLVVTSRVPLIQQWREAMSNGENIRYECIQTAYKLKEEYDLLIVDEVHRALSPKYRALFENIKYRKILCLTATLPKDKEYVEVLDMYAPIIYSVSLNEAVRDGVLPEFAIINYEIPFAKTQERRYKIFNQQFTEAMINLMKLRKSVPGLDRYKSAFDIAKAFKDAAEKSDVRKYARQFWSGMTMRKFAVYDNELKLGIAKNIVNRHPERKWMLFCKSIKFAESLQQLLPQSIIYHSKLPKNDRELALNLFNTNQKRVIIAVDGLTEGINSADADAAICLSGVSTELDNIQKIGRILRPKRVTPVYINFYTKDTVEENWVRAKTNKLINVTWSVHPTLINLNYGPILGHEVLEHQ